MDMRYVSIPSYFQKIKIWDIGWAPVLCTVLVTWYPQLYRGSVGWIQPSLAMQMFDSQIAPIMQYTSEVWFQNKECPILEKIHLAYMKNTVWVKPSSATKAICAEFGRFPLIIKQKCQILKYRKRVIEVNNDYYVKQAYNFTLELHDLGQTNWCTYVKAILNKTQLQQA